MSQTYGDFEILILDDCSPDNTPEVARSFRDDRVKYIRNERNLGHISNYNKGISLAAGKYVWLISADDLLRTPYVLGRYVELMEPNPRVGYAFCPVMELRTGVSEGVLKSSVLGAEDGVLGGRSFVGILVRRAVRGNSNGNDRFFSVEAPSVLVRKECYDRLGLFPLELPHAGDRYLWCVFALYYDVGYLAEPMVCYRKHDLNISEAFKKHSPNTIINDDIAVPWLVRQRAEAEGFHSVINSCENAIVEGYLSRIAVDGDKAPELSITLEYFEKSLAKARQGSPRRRQDFEHSSTQVWPGAIKELRSRKSFRFKPKESPSIGCVQKIRVSPAIKAFVTAWAITASAILPRRYIAHA